MSGTGQKIIAPSTLTEYRPDAIIVMNAIYTDEITSELEELGLSPEIIPFK